MGLLWVSDSRFCLRKVRELSERRQPVPFVFVDLPNPFLQCILQTVQEIHILLIGNEIPRAKRAAGRIREANPGNDRDLGGEIKDDRGDCPGSWVLIQRETAWQLVHGRSGGASGSRYFLL